jgi:hypothetical protein
MAFPFNSKGISRKGVHLPKYFGNKKVPGVNKPEDLWVEGGKSF